LRELGFFHSVAFFPAWANSIKFFQIGAAPLRPSQFFAIAFPLVFPTQTIVVSSGVYHAVQRSPGAISFFPFFQINCLFEVPVFAAARRHLRVRFTFHPASRDAEFESI
jgi:hypothetical protein